MVGMAHIRLGLLLLFAVSAGAADENGTLFGMVVDITGAPLHAARVCLYRSDFGGLCDNYTNVDGQFQIGELPPGIFKVTFTLQGFLEKTIPKVQIHPSRYDRTTIIVVGRSSATGEGSWLDEDCGLKLVIEGRDWPTSISTVYARSEFAPPPQMPKSFKWDKHLLQQK